MPPRRTRSGVGGGKGMMSPLRNAQVIGLCLVMELANCASGFAQNGQASATPPNGQELNGKIELLTRSLEQTQTELARSRGEIEQLRAMLGEVLKRMDATAALTPEGPKASTGAAPGPTGAETTATASQISQDDWDVLNARVDE